MLTFVFSVSEIVVVAVVDGFAVTDVVVSVDDVAVVGVVLLL